MIRLTAEQLEQKIATLKSNLANHPHRHVKSVQEDHEQLIERLQKKLNKLNKDS